MFIKIYNDRNGSNNNTQVANNDNFYHEFAQKKLQHTGEQITEKYTFKFIQTLIY